MSWPSVHPGELRRAGRAGLAGALVAGVLAVAFGTGYTSTRSLTNDDTVWLRKGDTIAQINAPSRRLQAAVDDRGGKRSLAAPGDALEVVQEPDGSVYVAVPGKHQVFKVDLSTMEPGPATAGNSVLAGGGAAFAVDSGKGTVTPLDPRTALPSGSPVSVGTPIQSQALDGSTVYAAGQDGSVTAISDGGKKTTRTQVGDKGARLSIAVAGANPTVVDSGAGTVGVLGGHGRAQAIRLPGAGGSPVQVAPNQPGPDVWLVRDHQLVDVRLAGGNTSSAALAGGHTFEPPVVFGDQVYVPDLSAHSVDVYDKASLQMIHAFAVPPGAPGDPGGIEVVAKAGEVWVDDPSSRDALALSAGGSQSRTVDKGTGADVVDPNAKPAAPAAPASPAAPSVQAPALSAPNPASRAPAVQVPILTPAPGRGGPPSPQGASPTPALPSAQPVTPQPVTPQPVTAPSAPPTPPPGGARKMAVPSLTAQPVAQACASVSSAGLTCGHDDKGKAPSGTPVSVVTAQSPQAGTQVDPASTVTVSYYSSAADVHVPTGLVNQSPDVACAAISGANLVCNRNPVPNAPVGAATNQVTSTSPPSGTAMAPGSPVAVNYYSSLTPVPAPECRLQSISALHCAVAGISVVPQPKETPQPIPCDITWAQSIPAGQPMAQGSTLIVNYDADCATPLYEFHQLTPDNQVYFLATTQALPGSNYQADGTVGTVYQTGAKPGLGPLYAFSYKDNTHHYFTTNGSFNNSGWRKTGIVGYVYANDPGGARKVFAYASPTLRVPPGEYQWSLSDLHNSSSTVWYTAP